MSPNIRFIEEVVPERQRVDERLEHEFMNKVLPRLLSPCSPVGVTGEAEVVESAELMNVNSARYHCMLPWLLTPLLLGLCGFFLLRSADRGKLDHSCDSPRNTRMNHALVLSYSCCAIGVRF